MGPGWAMTADAWIWMAVWIAALLVMIWLLVRGSDASVRPEEPLQILRRRLARGEISQAEYEHAKRVLELDKESRP